MRAESIDFAVLLTTYQQRRQRCRQTQVQLLHCKQVQQSANGEEPTEGAITDNLRHVDSFWYMRYGRFRVGDDVSRLGCALGGSISPFYRVHKRGTDEQVEELKHRVGIVDGNHVGSIVYQSVGQVALRLERACGLSINDPGSDSGGVLRSATKKFKSRSLKPKSLPQAHLESLGAIPLQCVNHELGPDMVADQIHVPAVKHPTDMIS